MMWKNIVHIEEIHFESIEHKYISIVGHPFFLSNIERFHIERLELIPMESVLDYSHDRNEH